MNLQITSLNIIDINSLKNSLTSISSQLISSRNQIFTGLSVFTFVVLAILFLKKNACNVKFTMPLFYKSLYFILSIIAFFYHSRFILSYFNSIEKDSILQLDERYPLMVGITLSVILTAFLYFLILKRLDWKIRSGIALIIVIPVVVFSNRLIADMIKLRLSIRLLNFLTELFFKQSLLIALYLILFILTILTGSPALEFLKMTVIFWVYLTSIILLNIEWIYLKFFSNISLKVPLSNSLKPFYLCFVIVFVFVPICIVVLRLNKSINDETFYFTINTFIQIVLYISFYLKYRYPLNLGIIFFGFCIQCLCLNTIPIISLLKFQGIIIG